MSIKLMAKVWECQFSKDEQSILLAMADHAQDDGTHCYPSVPWIAWKTDYSDRQVQRTIRKLCARGVLVLVRRGGRGRGHEYRIVLSTAKAKAPFGGGKGDTVSPQLQKGDVVSPITEPILAVQKGDIASPQSEKGDTMSPQVGAEKGDILARKGDICDKKGDILHRNYSHARSLTLDQPPLGVGGPPNPKPNAVAAVKEKAPETEEAAALLVGVGVNPAKARRLAADFAVKEIERQIAHWRPAFAARAVDVGVLVWRIENGAACPPVAGEERPRNYSGGYVPPDDAAKRNAFAELNPYKNGVEAAP